MTGGADIIDVKEPSHGSLGRATDAVWRDVRSIVPHEIPVTVALGELREWVHGAGVTIPPGAWAGLSYCKLGLSDAPEDWASRWRELDNRLRESASAIPAWVAVVYIDWCAAGAPAPKSVIDNASTLKWCQGVLFDTFDKSSSGGINLDWTPQIDRVRASGRFVALAGSLDAAAIRRLAPLSPDIFAVRGSACTGGDRRAVIDPERVKVLANAVHAEGTT